MGIIDALGVFMMPILLERVMDILKDILSFVGISLVYFFVAGLLLVAVLGRSYFPEGNLFDILITAFN